MTVPRVRSLLALSAILAASPAAWALDVIATLPPPTLEGEATAFSVNVQDGSETTEIRWDFGDGSEADFALGALTVEHTYAAPGHYTVTAVADDEGTFASFSFVHTVYVGQEGAAARSTTPLLLDQTRGLVICANADNATISLVDTESLEKVDEIPVFGDPVALAFAPDGKLWVVHRETYAVGIVDLDEGRMVDFFRLPYASQPVGLVFQEGGDAFIPLYATGEIVRVDPASHDLVTRKQVTPFPRGITISGDGSELWVTRFLSQGDHGEVFRLGTESLEETARIDLMQDTVTEDTDHSGRGLPNYLFSIALSPDGKRAWVPSKKDNMLRGLERDGLALTQDNAVRPLISMIDLENNEEVVEERLDLDDRNLPRSVAFSPYGDWAFVSMYGSNLVELRDTFNRSFVTALRAEELYGPITTVLSDKQQLFVLADLARKIVVFDVSDLLTGVDLATRVVATIPLVSNEKLADQVLRGKQVFANAEDKRMTIEGYVSCDSCHFEGFEDGLVWDFFDRGEGFRNTTSLLGRRGTGHGRVHWSANFDEIQDFDNPIRAHQGGLGFIAAEKWAIGTVSEPLGDPKAGLDTDLDALAAYVTSLDHVAPSPFRNSDGTLTADAQLGRQIFLDRDCDSCHLGDDFTNSAEGEVFDVGTLNEMSGSRLGGELLGIDTPTLLGIWQTAPYLHDGSAASLRDVLTTNNPEDLHGVTSDLSETELDQLATYLQQIDNELTVQDLVLPPDTGMGGEGAVGNTPASGGSESTSDDSGQGEADTGATTGAPDGLTGGTTSQPTAGADQSDSSGCSCSHNAGRPSTTQSWFWFLSVLLLARKRMSRLQWRS